MRQKKQIFYSALLLTGVNLLLRMVSTSFQVYLSGKIGAAGIGLVQLVLSVGIMSMTAGMAGIRTATMYLTAEELGHKKRGNVVWVLSGCFRYSLVCSASVAIVLYLSAPWLAHNWIGDIRTAGAIRLLSFSVPITCLCGVMTGYFTAANRIGTLAAVEVAEQLLSMAITIALLQFWAHSSPSKACQAVVGGSFVGACFTLTTLIILRLRESVPSGPRISVRSRLLQTAVPLAIADDLKTGITTTENLMVPKRLALYQGIRDPLAAFGMVCGMVFPVLMFPAAILFGLAELLIPELARCNAAGSRERIGYLVTRSLRVSMFYGCICCGIMYLCAGPVCMRLYGSAEAGKLLEGYALMVPFLYCDAITDAMTKGLGQQKVCVRYNIFTSAMDVVLLYLLLPEYGLAGYYFSFLVTHLLNFLLSLRRLIKISHCRFAWYVPVLTGACTLFSIFTAAVLPYSWIRVMSFLLLLGSSLCLLKILHREDLHWLWNLVRKK